MTASPAPHVFCWAADHAGRGGAYQVTAPAHTTGLHPARGVQRPPDPAPPLPSPGPGRVCGARPGGARGRERWACRTRLESLGPGPISVRPLYHFPLLRDLVVDMTPFAAKLRDVSAALTPRAGAEAYALVSSGSAERHEIDLAIECIGCGLCVSACTLVGHNGRFPGPAALNRALTLELDHRDAGREGRRRVLL